MEIDLRNLIKLAVRRSACGPASTSPQRPHHHASKFPDVQDFVVPNSARFDAISSIMFPYNFVGKKVQGKNRNFDMP
jgi:hypothetical protein